MKLQQLIPVLLLTLLPVQPVLAVRTSIVVFPLKNRSGDNLHNWMGYVFPEFSSRKLSEVEGIRIWDPLFMFQTDSLGWTMQSDSLLLQHCARWQWDAAVGGKLRVRNDTVVIELRIVWVTGTKQHVGMDLVRKAPVSGYTKICADLLLQTCSLLRIPLTHEDSLFLKNNEKVKPPAYHTYCAGYGFEMAEMYSEAQTAYMRAIELDPSFTLARCRSGGIYLRTGNTARAEKIFRQIIRSEYHTPYTRAMAADFAVEQFRPKVAFRYITESRAELEKSATGLTVIGKQYLKAGEYQRAIAAFRRAIAWGPTNLDTDFLLGMTYLWSGEYTTAIELFNRLINMRPGYTRYHVSLGAVYRSAGRLMEALSVLEAARKREPENTMVLIELAHTNFALTWYRKAGQLLEQASRIKPDQSDILVDLGIVYWHERRYRDAERCFKEAGRHREGAQASLVNFGNIALMQGNIGKAITAYRKADSYSKKSPSILYNLAVAYLRKGKPATAARYFDELLMLTPGRVDLLIERAHLAQVLGEHEDAELAYKRILDNDPQHEVAIDGLVRLLFQQKRYEEAVFIIESYLEVMPARGDFMVLLADAYREQGWYKVAMVKYQQVMQDFPDYPEGYLGVGKCMYEMVRFKGSKKYDEALYALKQASSKAPDNPVPYEYMGDIYMDFKGYREMAVEHWQKALAKCTGKADRKRIREKIVRAGR
jgi:tetratricopeptide (TPR) repeat protein